MIRALILLLLAVPTCAAAQSSALSSPAQIISGVTNAIGGTSVAAGTCTTTTVTIPGAALSMAAVANPTTGVAPAANFFFDAFVSAANTVTVRLCNVAITAQTPATSTYAVRVIQ